jgi:Bacterial PH domain/Short C-terminal domain
MGLKIIKWWNESYIITNRRVIQTEGIINKHVIDSSLEKVNDVVLTQSALGRMLGYGDVEILTASEIGVNRFERISGPVRFKTEMLNQKEDMGKIDDFGRRADRSLDAPPPSAGDIPELIAELDELRRKGLISEQEFAEKRQKLMGRIQ